MPPGPTTMTGSTCRSSSALTAPGPAKLSSWTWTRNLSCSFRIYLGQVSSYGRGLGTEATRLTLAHAFDTVGLHRVSLEVFDFNPRARHVYEKVGFVHEGTQRDALRWDGQWIDAHTMAILAPGWAAHRGYPAA
jgi:RimJ/RimL family protein N-acetyltransferase